MSEWWSWFAEHGVAFGALVASIRAMIRARTMRDAAAAEAMRQLSEALEETREKLERAERRSAALARELADLRRALRSDGR